MHKIAKFSGSFCYSILAENICQEPATPVLTAGGVRQAVGVWKVGRQGLQAFPGTRLYPLLLCSVQLSKSDPITDP